MSETTIVEPYLRNSDRMCFNFNAKEFFQKKSGAKTRFKKV
jgi:hypothetical protein